MEQHRPTAPKTADAREVPAALARRRSRVTVTVLAAVIAVIWVGPALILRPMVTPELLAVPTGFVVLLGFAQIRATSNVRGKFTSRQGHYLTASTWSGPRTIDLHALRRVRARRSPGVNTYYEYLIVTDDAGVTITFTHDHNFAMINKALDEQLGQRQPAGPVYISRLAKHVLRIKRLPLGGSFLWNMAMGMLLASVMVTCLVTVSTLAGG